jgi:hypothetical protein
MKRIKIGARTTEACLDADVASRSGPLFLVGRGPRARKRILYVAHNFEDVWLHQSFLWWVVGGESVENWACLVGVKDPPAAFAVKLARPTPPGPGRSLARSAWRPSEPPRAAARRR